MKDWREEIDAALKDFVTVANLADSPIQLEDFEVEYLEAPHRQPHSLPAGKMAIYGFYHNGNWLKIGMAGPNSNARYTSQHYNPNSAGSTLAKSLLIDSRMSALPGFGPSAPGEWIRSFTNRVNILLDFNLGELLVRLLEAYLHLRLRPRYER